MKQPVDDNSFINKHIKTEMKYWGTKQLFNLHHEVINVHGPGSLLTEISLLQNTLNLLAYAEVCWDLLFMWSTRF